MFNTKYIIVFLATTMPYAHAMQVQTRKRTVSLTAHAMPPEQMIAESIYTPEDICPICQEMFNSEQPVIAVHCAPNASTMHGQYHSCHATCLRGWWELCQQRNSPSTCVLCQRVTANISIPNEITLSQVVRRNYKLFFVFSLLSLASIIWAYLFITGAYTQSEAHSDIFCIISSSLIDFIFCASIFASSDEGVRLLEDFKQYFNKNPELLRLFIEGGVIELQ